jgi:hypothetical protein
MRIWMALFGLFLLWGNNAWSQAVDPEVFLAPRQVTNFTEQKLVASIKGHKHGNISDALFIQRKLAQYYEERGDSKSAKLCKDRADAAERMLKPKPTLRVLNESVQSQGRQALAPRPPEPSKSGASMELKGTHSDWSGRYYSMEGGSLNKWDFNTDGTFMHEVVASGAGTSVRNLERGIFTVVGNTLELTIAKHVSAYATPGVETRGSQTTQLGAATQSKSEKRQMKIRFFGSKGEKGIELDGKPLKVRSWN